ncbi:MAG: acetate--CoA ligase family protein [Pseudomonadota bacterium]
MALSRLLAPRSIAVVGGGAWGGALAGACRSIGFDGDLWAVHPTRADIGGIAAVPQLADLPAPPDATFLAINREATVQAVSALNAMGAGGAVCFASGFREAASEMPDGPDLEAALLEAAGEMPILGPNCYGFLNALDSAALWPDVHGLQRVERGVAIVSQSSNIALNLTMQRRGLPVAVVACVGNGAQIGLAALSRALLEDDRVTALGLYIEGVGNLAAFAEMAKAAHAAGKPVVAVKSGATETARAATVSHTASLAGNDAGAMALFDRLGVVRVSDLETLIETLKVLHVAGPLGGSRVASMSSSGGEAGLMADLGTAHGLSFPPLDRRQSAGLRAALGPRVALSNPLDYHTYIWGDQDKLATCFGAMMAGDADVGTIVLDFPRADRCDGASWAPVVDAAAAVRATTGKPMALLSSLAETMPEDEAARMIALGLIPLAGLGAGLAALAGAARAGATADPGRIEIPRSVSGGRTLSEGGAKAMLRAQGVDVPRGVETAQPADAGMPYPVVLKALGLAHKTEAGLVALNLADAGAVRCAAARMAAEQFLVEEMVVGGVAELLVGVVRDPAHGFVLTLGAGGVLAEMLDDTVSLLVPATEAEIGAALNGLRLAPVLSGWRGRPGVDRASVVAAIMGVQRLVLAEADRLIEIEINPLICTETRAVAADALITLGESE